MILHKDSHTDHVSNFILGWVLATCERDGLDGFFIKTLVYTGPDPSLTCGLYGPAMGDEPVGEDVVTYEKRPGRGHVSRLVPRPRRPTTLLTVIAGPYDGHPCVLYTAFGGPPTPKEPGDVTIKSEAERKEAEEFWAQHALAR
jgi:hypothetical protein